MHKFQLFIIACVICSCTAVSPDGESQYQSFAPDGIPFVVADSTWNVDGFGNHRAVVSVKNVGQEAVVVDLPWRRPDIRPEIKKVLVVDASSGLEIKNVCLIDFSSEKGVVAFQPETTPGTYYIYYLPAKYRGKWGSGRGSSSLNDYLPPEYNADPEWEKKVKSNSASFPQIKPERFEARTKFDFFTPVGLIATAEEIQALRGKYQGDFTLFPEDRAYPIRLTTIPVRWTSKAYNKGFQPLAFEGYALPNEYYTWQIGLWASREALKNVRLTFSDFTHSSGKQIIPADEITCFNTGGINWDGNPVRFEVDTPKDKVQALWCGLQIPETVRGGKYTGTVSVSADNVSPQKVDVVIHVGKQVLADKGDGDLWRHARLRWLNSTIGIDSLPVAPYQPLQLDGKKITATGKTLLVGNNGLLQSVVINDCEVFEKPVTFEVITSAGTVPFAADNIQLKKTAPGLVSWEASAVHKGIKFNCEAWMEYDGYVRYNLKVSSDKEIQVNDIRLVMSYTPAASEYFMGVGHEGGIRPTNYIWDWKGFWDSYWTGSWQAGIHQEFRGGTYHGPLLRDYMKEAPPVWTNEGKGRISVSGALNRPATVVASTGSKILSNIPANFEFALLVTPLKPLNTAKHFSERYYHSNPEGFDKAAEEGANIANIHHAQALNPVINYPFIVREPLIAFIKTQHAADRKVKLYYTIRELSNYCTEIYALKSLNQEILASSENYIGLPWQCEHLIDDYSSAWYTQLPEQNYDASVIVKGFSRWLNYYLEGLRWMFENYEIDGLYMDDVAFDRETMKRIRKIMAQYRPEAIIDLHSHKWYSNGPANQYTGFFPYVDRLWFGENFKYNRMMPDEWLTTFSGIPFGVMSEMLEGGGNRFLGMVYGTTARHFYGEFSPAPVWKLWKDFGIESAQMIGYWDKACPVKTNHPNVKATAYVREGKTLISIGNFDEKDQHVRLSFDWEKLGIKASEAKLHAPAVQDFQEERTFKTDEAIPVKSKEGWLLILSEK